MQLIVYVKEWRKRKILILILFLILILISLKKEIITMWLDVMSSPYGANNY